MKRFVFLFALIALFAVNEASAKTGDVITGYVTCVEKDGSRHSVEMMFQITSQNLKYVRIYGYCNDSGFHNSLSLYERLDLFDGCEIIVPEKMGDYTVTAVGQYAFCYCWAKVTLPESVTDIEDYAFAGYKYNEYDFVLPSKVRFLGKYAFQNSYLKGISLNDNLKNIGDYAFEDCTSLQELIIPKSVEYIGKGITTWTSTLPVGGIDRVEVESGCNNYYTPEGSNVIMETKTKTIIAGCPNSRIPEETRGIAQDAFHGTIFTNTSITIPEDRTKSFLS